MTEEKFDMTTQDLLLDQKLRLERLEGDLSELYFGACEDVNDMSSNVDLEELYDALVERVGHIRRALWHIGRAKAECEKALTKMGGLELNDMEQENSADIPDGLSC